MIWGRKVKTKLNDIKKKRVNISRMAKADKRREEVHVKRLSNEKSMCRLYKVIFVSPSSLGLIAH